MRRLIVIERSRTLRYLLTRLFQGAGYTVDIFSGYSSGFRAILANRGFGRDYAGIILGWPTGADLASDELIKALEERPFDNNFILVLSHEASPSARTWIAERGRGGYLLWSNYPEIVRTIDLHLENAESEPASMDIQAASTGAGLQVLFVDDSPSSRVFFRKLLLTRGYQVDTASNGEAAMEKLNSGRFHLAIIDYYLPDTTGGRLCAQLKASGQLQQLSCAVITGAYSDELIRDCLNAGAVECMFKSEPPELFVAQVDAMARSVRTQHTLYERQQLLDGILGAVNEGMVVVDDDDQILYVNQAARDWLGYATERELVGENAREILHTPADGAGPAAGSRKRTNADSERGTIVESVPQILVRQDGQRIAVLTSAYALRIHHRRIGTVIAFRRQTERAVSDKEVWWQATHDPLTKLLNRSYFEVQVETELHRLRNKNTHSVMVILSVEPISVDVETAEQYDSEPGPIVGGLPRVLLETVGDLLTRRTRPDDLLAYLGDGQFAVLFRDIDRGVMDALRRTLQRILDRARTSTSFKFDGTIGIAVVDGNMQTAHEAIGRAEHARQLAKKKGQDQIHLYSVGGSGAAMSGHSEIA